MSTYDKSDFQAHLSNIFEFARSKGITSLTLNAKKVHQTMGSYPEPNQHSMATLCRAMKDVKIKHFILFDPKKGNGASLTIEYFIE